LAQSPAKLVLAPDPEKPTGTIDMIGAMIVTMETGTMTDTIAVAAVTAQAREAEAEAAIRLRRNGSKPPRLPLSPVLSKHSAAARSPVHGPVPKANVSLRLPWVLLESTALWTRIPIEKASVISLKPQSAVF